MGLQAFLRATRPVEGPAQQVRVAGVADSAQSLLARPLAWALAALGLSDDTQDSDLDDQLWHSHRGDWVVYANLDKATDALLARHLSATLSPLDALHSRDSLRRLLPALSLSDTDMTVLLKHLERDRKLAILDKGVRNPTLILTPHLLTLDQRYRSSNSPTETANRPHPSQNRMSASSISARPNYASNARSSNSTNASKNAPKTPATHSRQIKRHKPRPTSAPANSSRTSMPVAPTRSKPSPPYSSSSNRLLVTYK